MSDDHLPPFVRPLAPRGEPSEPLTLTPEAKEQLEAELGDIRRAHAAALESAHRVVIWR